MKSVMNIRTRLGLSQKALADAVGIKQSTVSAYETGRAEIPADNAQKLIDLARVHGLLIDFNHVYGGVDLPPELPGRAKPVQVQQAPPPAAFPPISRRKVVR